jgi:lysine 6-dehydrogenase
MRFLVLGAGKQGSACALDLLQVPGVAKVIIADRTFEHLPEFLTAYRDGPRLELLVLDYQDRGPVLAAMGQVQSVLSAAPYYFNAELARLAVEAGAHFADLGGNTEIVFAQKKLHEAAADRGVSIIPDCGLAPGMINILAAEGIRRLDRTESVRIYVGGLPQQPEPPLNYMVVYSLEGALDYYTTPSWVLRDARRTQVDALSEQEEIVFPELGTLEAFHTAGGISTMPFSYEGKIPVMEYKTLRYPGHMAIMRAIRDLGLLDDTPIEVNGRGTRVSPRQVFIAAVSPKLTRPGAPDLVALRVEVRGVRDGRPAGTRWQMVDRYDAERGVTAMMRTTGYSLAVTGLMQVDGRIAARGAYVPDECVPAAPYVAELAKRGIVISEESVG